jgi:hypothetical protein
VPTLPRDRRWLDALVAGELERYDPASALARLPVEVRDAATPDDLAPVAQILVARSLRRRRLDPVRPPPGITFVEDVRSHVGLLLDLALVRGDRFDPARRRAEMAAFLASAVGEEALAVAAYDPAAAPRTVAKALRGAGAALRAQLYPPGDPVHGLPVHPGHVAVQRRRLARIAMGHHRHGRLEAAALARHAAYAEREAALLVETLAGLLAAAGPVDPRAPGVRQRQLLRLGYGAEWVEEARRTLAAPRAPEEVARAAPERVRPFLLEQLLLAVLRARLPGEGPTRFVETFAAAAGLDPAAVAAARVEAAAQHGDHQVWFDAFDEGGGASWHAFSVEWDAAADQIVERVSAAVTGNLDAIVTEIRETGELGALLAKAAAGAKLTADERRKVRAQLVDLAKAVPALAIFAAPGGMLLLPLLAKLLPFKLMPSAWDRRPEPKAQPAPAPGTAAAPSPSGPDADGEPPKSRTG